MVKKCAVLNCPVKARYDINMNYYYFCMVQLLTAVLWHVRCVKAMYDDQNDLGNSSVV